ncbi:sigma-70 family RNA polymerase sigma factor [Paenibacillus aceris]|uniref:RNA polymerase sigma-B factor n=1 Tax=Paenibacillus aceris TaxID=869555 RepID=A0ABS4I1E4_9BACL|nr:sigma-70 family RNA polymerase sigma factor [Paenibacillus aceris]MBP1964739.1 RNA polymerase sigma-B factor [Paenibacillus aceris]NHW33725.1 sigma-70 family RNA polymerase sigma factor [Paenibacillus aceris]
MNVNASSSKPLYDMYVKMKIYKETACQETATALLLHYEPIVRMAVGKMSRSRPDLYEDLFQVGQMSLLRLFTQYDSTLETPFEAYAMKSLIGHLKNYLRDKSWYIQVPRRIKEKGALVQRTLDELTVKLERSPNIDEMAAYLELSTEETIEILAGRDYYHYTSLDTPLTSEGDSATIGDMIAGSTDEYQSLERRMDLEEAMTCLKEEERKVIHLIYQEGKSQRQIAEQLGISQMSVSRIQKRAIVKLKTVLTPNV